MTKNINDKIKVLCYADSPTSATGFSTVSRNILMGLYNTGKFDISILGINYWGDPHEFPFKIYPTGINNDRDPYGRKKVFNMIQQMDFDILFFLQDTFILDFLPDLHKVLRNKGKEFKSIVYYPIDGTPKEKWLQNVAVCDYVYAYSEFGKNKSLEVLPDMRISGVIPHGANIKEYFPLDKDTVSSFRKQYFGSLHDKFIITNLNRNQQRKDIPRTIAAFVEFRKQVKDSVLYLHMAKKDQGWDLEEIVNSYGLNTKNDVIFPENFGPNQGYPRQIVNMIYNASNCIVSTTLGEGWGLCLHEDTNIMTTMGSIKIKDVVEGEKVVLGGKSYNIRGTCSSNKNKAYKIKLYNNQEIIVSPEHKIPVYDGEYKEASDITINDKLIIDKAVLYDDSNYIYDMSMFSDKLDDTHVWNKMGFSPKNKNSITTIMDHTGETKKIVENSIKVFLDGKVSKSERVNNVVEYLDSIDYSRPFVKINRYVDFTPEFSRLLGYYVAEGSNENGKGVEFSFHSKEIDYHEDVKYLMKKYFGVDSDDKSVDNRYAIRYRSSILSKFFGKLCGVHSYNKHIPLLCLQHKNKAKEFIKGAWRGDGHFGDIELSYSTSSVKLKEEMMWLLSGFNIFSKSNKNKQGNYHIYVNGEDYNILSDVLDYNGKHNTYKDRKYLIKENECFILDIKSIENYDCKDDLFYDLSIEGKEHFVANGVVVHNSWVEAMATKTPVIMPNNTAFTENITDNNGWLYNSGSNTSLFTVVPNDNEVIRPLADVEDLVKKLLEVYNNKEEVDKRVNNAYNWLVTKMDWENSIVPEWLKVFDKAWYDLNNNILVEDDKSIKTETL